MSDIRKFFKLEPKKPDIVPEMDASDSEEGEVQMDDFPELEESDDEDDEEIIDIENNRIPDIPPAPIGMSQPLYQGTDEEISMAMLWSCQSVGLTNLHTEA